VLDKGKKFKEDFLILKIFPNTLNQTRFAFIVSQKFSKSSAQRNKIKRKLRELVKSRLKNIRTLPSARTLKAPPILKKGIDVVMIPIRGLETKTFKEIDKDLNELFKRAKILKP